MVFSGIRVQMANSGRDEDGIDRCVRGWGARSAVGMDTKRPGTKDDGFVNRNDVRAVCD